MAEGLNHLGGVEEQVFRGELEDHTVGVLNYDGVVQELGQEVCERSHGGHSLPEQHKLELRDVVLQVLFCEEEVQGLWNIHRGKSLGLQKIAQLTLDLKARERTTFLEKKNKKKKKEPFWHHESYPF